MAKASYKLPEELLVKLSRLTDRMDDIAGEAATAGAEVLAARVQSNLGAVVGKNTRGDNHSTGELVSSLGVSPPKVDKNGNMNVKVGFSEPRSDGGSNAMLANILEYGKHGQPPKPFLKTAVTSSKAAVESAMTAVLQQEVDSI